MMSSRSSSLLHRMAATKSPYTLTKVLSRRGLTSLRSRVPRSRAAPVGVSSLSSSSVGGFAAFSPPQWCWSSPTGRAAGLGPVLFSSSAVSGRGTRRVGASSSNRGTGGFRSMGGDRESPSSSHNGSGSGDGGSSNGNVIAGGEAFEERYALAKKRLETGLVSTNATVLNSLSPAAPVLEHPALVVTREIEMMNLFIGFEQANRYSIATPTGQIVGYMAEEDSLGKSLARNVLKTHRSFTSTIMDTAGNVVLRIKRPVYLVNSTISIENAEGEVIGEVLQSWHLWRRRYDLFNREKVQFGSIDSGFLAYEFDIVNEEEKPLARIDKDFVGFMREIFTDANQYIIKMDMLDNSVRTLLYDERAVTLAAAISIDFDYFSRHSRAGGHGGFMPFMFPGFGGGSERSSEAPGAEPAAGVPIEPPAGSGVGGGLGGAGLGGALGGSSADGSTAGDFGPPPPSSSDGGMEWGSGDFGSGSGSGGKTNEWGDPVMEDDFDSGDAGGEEGGSVIGTILGSIFGSDE
eukprot:Nk52_evm2s659 gene=Nk52_evmTU2s659